MTNVRVYYGHDERDREQLISDVASAYGNRGDEAQQEEAGYELGLPQPVGDIPPARELIGLDQSVYRQIAAALRKAYAVSGERGFWQTVIELLKQKPKQNFDLPFDTAEAYRHLGDKDRAFEWYQKAADERHPGMDTMKVDPLFDSLRSDPRFPDLLRRAGLAP